MFLFVATGRVLGVWATVGIHPSDNHKEEWDEGRFAKLAKMPKVVGIGECGLDYYRLDADHARRKIANRDDEIDRQRDLFEHQMEFAASHDLPLMLHGRPTKGTMDAYEDMLYMLEGASRGHGDRLRGDIHFFVGDTIIAKRFLDLGFSMSFTGVITFAPEYDEVIRYIPPDRILLETDSPYVAPIPNRGKRNEPAYMIPIYQKMAEIRNTSLDDLIERTRMNIQRTFQFH